MTEVVQKLMNSFDSISRQQQQQNVYTLKKASENYSETNFRTDHKVSPDTRTKTSLLNLEIKL